MTNSRQIQLQAPSKTFLLGEYAVLSGGTGLLMATPPYFELTISENHNDFKTAHDLFHPESPAGRLVAKHPELKQYRYQFTDPHHGLGGFGASSAQFLLLYQFLNRHSPTQQTLQQLYPSYRQLTQNENASPSGADVMCQAHGGVTIFHGAQTIKQDWPFTDLAICFIRTGTKLATHTHLHDLKTDQFNSLKTIAFDANTALKQVDCDAFCQAIQHYHAELATRNLLAAHTAKLLESIHTAPGVRASKGCGAMGADVILALVDRTQLAVFKKAIADLSLDLVFAGTQTAPGSLTHSETTEEVRT